MLWHVYPLAFEFYLLEQTWPRLSSCCEGCDIDEAMASDTRIYI